MFNITRLLSTLLFSAGAVIAAPSIARAQRPSHEGSCRNALEGRIAWNAAGETHWNPNNIERLCAGGRGEEPARCFERLMRGRVNWGGGTNWEWENAVKLCHGSRDAGETIACFEGQIRANIPWERAIGNCNVEGGGSRPQPPPVVVDQMTVCREAVQGKIPWNSRGETAWNPNNIERLCKGGVTDQPARCFERLMRGQVNWGGGTNWEWENAVNLCHGSQDAGQTISCFEGQIRARIPWERAIPACGVQEGGMRPPPPPPPPPDQMTVCRNAVQGRIAWNKQGETRWEAANVERLCAGGVADEPAKCFNRVMHGGVSWGGDTSWKWENAIDLCRGSNNHDRTVRCFEAKIRAKIHWKAAVTACRG